MKKTKRNRLVLVICLMFSLLTMYGAVPVAKAASMESAKDTLSDSDLGVAATHTIVFDMGTAIIAGEYVQVDFASQFGDANAVGVVTTCPGTTVVSSSTDYVRCTGALASTSAATITVAGIANPGSFGSYNVTVSTHQAGGAEIESSQMKVYIIDDVTVTAHVDASLTFAVASLASSTTINGVETTGSSTATALAYNTLPVDTAKTLGQTLTVSTNAQDGYVVTVQQTGELSTAAGSNINSFKNAADGSGSTSPEIWSSPTHVLGSTKTYGHMGLTSDDTSNMSVDYSGSKFVGLNGTVPVAIMNHTGPAAGATVGAGLAHVLYSIEISPLQEAGDYSTYLTYVCTATY